VYSSANSANFCMIWPGGESCADPKETRHCIASTVGVGVEDASCRPGGFK